ncbi:hypothetical protein RclHR1_40660002 [Rhizophagus clarus]|uniref:Integrase catalytic domain-containing protein n=1 Tax=Rhizophagus clarus TaxID=94130 RepID=A0A2Z6RS75_9GLOM|nr:hypothetical protein RclHR1_40660002 [Rhizophagus clarus]
MSYDKVGQITYFFCLNIVDVASRYKKIYDDPEIPLVWPKLLITDRGPEFRGDCEKLMREHSVKIQKAKSKPTMGIVERYNRTLREKCGLSQDASDLLLPITERSRAWVKNLPLVVEDINNSITRQLGISPVDAIKEKEVFAKPSYLWDGPIGFDEEKLSNDVLVRYLLYPIDLEDGRRHAGDLNWSSCIYHIWESMVQKNQPVLYWLEEVPFGLTDDDDYVVKHPKRSFVREELMVISFDTELPSQWVLMN